MSAKQLVFATGNKYKLREVRSILGEKFLISSLDDIGCHQEIPETNPTIEGNALQKAHYVKDNFGLDCFAEDTGLEIDALNGEPGVHSARYAGDAKDAKANIELVLRNMAESKIRTARFKTVIALILEGEVKTFEGIIEGTIENEPSGSGGFGYDPIFVPNGYKQTFAELDADIKNKISHRALAVSLLIDYLKEKE